jgi:hypothetical protein
VGRASGDQRPFPGGNLDLQHWSLITSRYFNMRDGFRVLKNLWGTFRDIENKMSSEYGTQNKHENRSDKSTSRLIQIPKKFWRVIW